jgi:hypothetical protein
MLASAGALLLLPRGGPYRKKIVASLVPVVVAPAIFFLAVFPYATSQRRLRHTKEMPDRIPVLMSFVADVEASSKRLKRIPADDDEFFEVISTRHRDREDMLGCCWGIYYFKVSASRYRLVYDALDVKYTYDSASPEQSWCQGDGALTLGIEHAANNRQPQNPANRLIPKGLEVDHATFQ